MTAQPTEPLDVDGVAATTWGTVTWLVALGVLLVSGVRFGDPNGWWLTTCIVGALLGVAGMVFTRRRAAVYQAHAQSHVDHPGGADRSGRPDRPAPGQE